MPDEIKLTATNSPLGERGYKTEMTARDTTLYGFNLGHNHILAESLLLSFMSLLDLEVVDTVVYYSLLLIHILNYINTNNNSDDDNELYVTKNLSTSFIHSDSRSIHG